MRPPNPAWDEEMKQYYSVLAALKCKQGGGELGEKPCHVFQPMSDTQRRAVHAVADWLGLDSTSTGEIVTFVCMRIVRASD